MSPVILLIDNYDSFTYNIVQYLSELGAEVQVARNDAITPEAALSLAPEALVISPGPGRPQDTGISMALIEALPGRMPVFGVCLGHQCIAEACGGRIGYAREVMHGKLSMIHHDGSGCFRGLPSPFSATRYHSLVAEPDSLPDCLVVHAWTETPDGERDEIMGLRHKTLPMEGVQFHPESILCEHGHALLKNFLHDVERAGARRDPPTGGGRA